MDLSKNIDVVVVEDNEAYAKMLRHILDQNPALNCREIYPSAEAFADELDTIDHEPEVILLDLHLPGRDGLSLIPLLNQKLPETRILILTQNDSYLQTLEAIRMGAGGYILKNSSSDEIERSIVEVSEGGCVIDSKLCKCVLEVMDSKAIPEQLLSPREHQILELLAVGYSKKEVAAHLTIAYRTVAQGTERIYKKLQVPNVTAAVAKAIRNGII